LYHIRHTTPILKITKLDKRKALDLQELTKVIYLGCGTRENVRKFALIARYG
jgi:hypothetical protein